jgi:hypothetical protein
MEMRPSWEQKLAEENMETERMLSERWEQERRRTLDNKVFGGDLLGVSDGRAGLDGPVDAIVKGGLALWLIIVVVLVLLGLGGFLLRIWFNPDGTLKGATPAATTQNAPAGSATPSGTSATQGGASSSSGGMQPNANPCGGP